jgi:hypothetical protein
MVNYSIVMRSNPMDVDAAKKAYASAQYSEVMDINRFAEHIASHGCVQARGHRGHPHHGGGLHEGTASGRTEDTAGRLGGFLHQHQQYRSGKRCRLQSCHPCQKAECELECRNTFPELAGGSYVQSGGYAQGGPTGGEGAESRKDQCGSYRRGEGAGKRRTGLTEPQYDGGKTRR